MSADPPRDDPGIANLILRALPRDEYQRILPYLQTTPLRPGQALYEPNDAIRFAYFPNSGMVSLVATMNDGTTVEIGITGREGFVGTPILLGFRVGAFRAVVQLAGEALQIESGTLQKLLPRMPRLDCILRRYIYAEFTQLGQSAACNRLHELGPRLSRWLLASRDCARSNVFSITQDFLGQMLGCCRPSVTEAANSLQKAGLISYSRGRVQIVNRRGLEAAACECYENMKRYARAVLE